jgi:hypothetical protein
MESHELLPSLAPVCGTIIRRDDIDTGFSPHNPKERRRYLVIEVRNRRVRVVPLCSEGPGVFIEPETLKDESARGYFIRWSTTPSYDEAAASAEDEHVRSSLVDEVREQWRPIEPPVNPPTPKDAR